MTSAFSRDMASCSQCVNGAVVSVDVSRRPRLSAMKYVTMFFLSALAYIASAEEAASFTLASGVRLKETSVITMDERESVVIRKDKDGYEVIVLVFMPCSGDMAAPWLTVGSKATLVLAKKRPLAAFHSGEECRYKVRVSIARNRLERGNLLYVVNDQVAVGHATVP